jgi:hypothetical protein
VARLQLALGDVDANGTAEVILAAVSDSKGTWLLATGAVDRWGAVALPKTADEALDTDWPIGVNADGWDFSSADIDADGRADIALTRVKRACPPYGGPCRREPNDAVYVATSTRGATKTFEPRPQPVQLDATYTVLADADADGRADLMTGAPVGEALADRQGGFSPWAASAPEDPACPANTSIFIEEAPAFMTVDAGHPPSTVDANGDDRADRVCVEDVGPGPFTARDIVSPSRPADLHRWMPADITGTGRQSLVYVQFQNPGYKVHTLTPNGSGSFERSSKPVEPQPETPSQPEMPLDNPDAGGWMPIDVGRPGPGDGGRRQERPGARRARRRDAAGKHAAVDRQRLGAEGRHPLGLSLRLGGRAGLAAREAQPRRLRRPDTPRGRGHGGADQLPDLELRRNLEERQQPQLLRVREV